jgi:asparagine synthase (glutamine-hydrolysing)
VILPLLSHHKGQLLSGIAVIYECIKTPVDTGVLMQVMEKLKHRGLDGEDTWISDNVAIGHLHFWVTPEEQGERQPLRLPEIPNTIVLDGRIDNRDELIIRLDLDGKRHVISDAELILHAYARYGKDCFSDLIGDFAFVIFDEKNNELICARDAVGDRSLFYGIHGTRVIVGSEPWAIAAGLGTGLEIEERATAMHFALMVPEDGKTLYKGIYELLPGQWISVNGQMIKKGLYWSPEYSPKRQKRSEKEYVEEFQELLETSIRCRMRSETTPGVMMSGGLDSTSIAALASRMINPQKIKTFSYVFDQFHSCDERKYINVMQNCFNIESIQVICDDAWPYKTWPKWPDNPNWPSMNPYRLILEEVYSAIQKEGTRVILNGMYGDNLFSFSTSWLADLLADKKWKEFFCEVHLLFKAVGFQNTITSGYFHDAVKQIGRKIPGTNLLQKSFRKPDWLTEFGKNLLSHPHKKWITSKESLLFNLRDAAGNSQEIYNTNRYGFELRSPYHDRRLLEFMLNLPAYLLYFKGETKRILRTAMQGVLPEEIRMRRERTNLLEIYNFGVRQRRKEIKKFIIEDNLGWNEYVKVDQVIKEWGKEILVEDSGGHTTLPSLCVFYELWYKSYINQVFGE